jgi:hypothetical protein
MQLSALPLAILFRIRLATRQEKPVTRHVPERASYRGDPAALSWLVCLRESLSQARQTALVASNPLTANRS